MQEDRMRAQDLSTFPVTEAQVRARFTQPSDDGITARILARLDARGAPSYAARRQAYFPVRAVMVGVVACGLALGWWLMASTANGVQDTCQQDGIVICGP